MIYFLIGCASLGVMLLFYQWVNTESENNSARKKRIVVIILCVVVIAVLVRFGLSHLAALLGILLAVIPYLARIIQGISLFRQLRAMFNSTPKPTASHSKMTNEEARDILGVKENATEKDIKQAYRDKMKLHHPDKGGSATFASQLALAKEILLKNHNKS